MNPRASLPLALLGLGLLFALTALYFRIQDAPPAPPEPEPAQLASEAAPVEPPAEEPGGALDAEVEEELPQEPLRRQSVLVYFPGAELDGLVGEEREIFGTASPGDRAKQILADVVSGPTSPEAARAVPLGTRLLQVYVLETGVAYVDFSSDLKRGIGGGSMAELLTVYAIVDSVALNVSEIKRVGILIEGRADRDPERPRGPQPPSPAGPFPLRPGEGRRTGRPDHRPDAARHPLTTKGRIRCRGTTEGPTNRCAI